MRLVPRAAQAAACFVLALGLAACSGGAVGGGTANGTMNCDCEAWPPGRVGPVCPELCKDCIDEPCQTCP